ncbi:MAG: ImmA/IrrE family metallo-endopeptidase [Neisseriaceae bacterium]
MNTQRNPDYHKAEQEALKILNECGIIEPPVDLFKITEDYGIGVQFVEFKDDYKAVSGFYSAKQDTIFVNEEEFPSRQFFTIAHELGHRFLHRTWVESIEYQVLLREQLENPSKDWHEREANCFAANLLVPKFILDKYKDAPIESLAILFSVSRPMISHRLKFLYEYNRKCI